jgi:hypothetical protein
MNTQYSEKLRDPRWRAKRNKIIARDGWKCRDCGSDDAEQFHVHHCFYRGNPWDVEDNFLLTLCEACHIYRQGLENSLRLEIGRLSSSLKPADVDRFRARFHRLVFEFEAEIEKFSELVHRIEEGNQVG